METVLPAIIVMVIMLFAILTDAYTFTQAQTRIQAGQQVMQTRMGDQSRTALTAVDTQVSQDGDSVDATFRNSGSTRLTDFAQWDLIVNFYDDQHTYRTLWLPFHTGSSPTVQEWALVGLYMDAANAIPEVYEPGILNPGEEMVIRLRVPSPAQPGVAGQVIVTTPNGITSSIFFTRPLPPTPTPEPTSEPTPTEPAPTVTP